MCWDRLQELLTEPDVGILKGKRERNLTKTLELLIIEWFLIGLSILIATQPLGLTNTIISVAVIVALFGMAGTLFYGFLTQIVMNVLGGKGKYYEGLTAMVYPKIPVSVGLFVGSIFLNFTGVGMLLALVAGIVFMVLGVSTLYRGMKEMFGVDMIHAWIGISVLILSTLLALYAVLLIQLLPQLLTASLTNI